MSRPGFRQRPAKKAKPNPSRNSHVERGRPITVADVAPYARQKCQKCRGKGMVGVKLSEDGTPVSATPCKCATVRFFKAKPEIILDEEGRAWWPAEGA